MTDPNKRTLVDTTNCPDTGTTIFLSGLHTMKKMGLKVANLYKDQTRCLTADGSPLNMLGFIPVLVRVKDRKGTKHEVNECFYFVEGVNSTLVSLRCLKSLGCVPEHWPLPAAQVFGVTERDNMEEDEEMKIIERQPTPKRPERPHSLALQKISQGSSTGWRICLQPAPSTPPQHQWLRCRAPQ